MSRRVWSLLILGALYWAVSTVVCMLLAAVVTSLPGLDGAAFMWTWAGLCAVSGVPGAVLLDWVAATWDAGAAALVALSATGVADAADSGPRHLPPSGP